MKVTGIYPHLNYIVTLKMAHMHPMSFSVLKTLTPTDVDFVFIDDRLEEIPWDDPTDLVAISVETFNARRAYEIADRFRRRGIPVVMGGIHATLAPSEAGEHADAIVMGGAESLWPQVVRDFERRSPQKVYRADETTDTLQHVPPDRSIFSGNRYFPASIVETGRGCPHHCDFCAVAAMCLGHYRTKTIEAIEEDVASTSGHHVYLADDNFVARPRRTIDLCRALAKHRKRWMAEGSVTIAQNRDLMRAMRDAGCVCILIGFESLSIETLRAMGKTWSGAQRSYGEAIDIIHDHGIAIYGSFVFGYDADTVDDIKRTLEFAVEKKLMLASFHQVIPFPGTPLYARYKEAGRLLYDTWYLEESYRTGMPMTRPLLMTPDELAEACRASHTEFYSARGVLRRVANTRCISKNPATLPYFFMENCTSWKSTIVQVS